MVDDAAAVGGDGTVELVDGWEVEAHHDTGLAVAAAGVGEGGVRERERDVPGPKGIEYALGILIPSPVLPLYDLALLFLFFLPK